MIQLKLFRDMRYDIFLKINAPIPNHLWFQIMQLFALEKITHMSPLLTKKLEDPDL